MNTLDMLSFCRTFGPVYLQDYFKVGLKDMFHVMKFTIVVTVETFSFMIPSLIRFLGHKSCNPSWSVSLTLSITIVLGRTLGETSP